MRSSSAALRAAPASPASAIGWELLRQHRWGFRALVGYLVLLAAAKTTFVARGASVDFESPLTFAFVVVVPMATTFTYCLAVFTYGLSGDIIARRSMYPARMFAMPVSSAALAGWPMLFGGAAMAMAWAALRLFAMWPAGVDIPYVWPALLAAAFLAWTQALTWMPYGLPGMRLIATVLCLSAIDAVVLLALHFHASERVMLALIVPQIPLAYVLARWGVSRARFGVVPDWSGVFDGLRSRASGASARAPRIFSSASSAQRWLEWRQHGRTLPSLVALLLPFEILVLFAARGATELVFTIVAGILLTPPFMAAFVAATVRKGSVHSRGDAGLSPFVAARPLTGAQLIGAKLRMSIESTLVTWAIVLVAIPIGLWWSGTWPDFSRGASHVVDAMGRARAIVLLLLIVAACIASTWKQLVQTLYIGLAGRDWIVKLSLAIMIVLLVALGPLTDWLRHDAAARRALWDALPSVLALLVLVKVATAMWIATKLHEARLVSDGAMVAGAAAWCAAVLGLSAVLRWWVATHFFPVYVLVLIAILMAPLARVSAAPLALQWNRHR